MSNASLPILETILKSWADGFRAVRDMPVVTACGLVLHVLIIIGIFFAAGAILLNSGRNVDEWVASPAWFVFVVFNAAVRVVLLAPLFIAIHRYIINGQRARSYPLNPLRPSYLRYVGAALAAYIAFRLPEMVGVLLAPLRSLVLFDVLFYVLMWAMMIMIAVLLVGRITLFPAIAVNAPRATWRETEMASAASLMRTIVIVAAIIGPAQIGGWLLQTYVPLPYGPNGQLMSALLTVPVDFPALCALAAAMARIFAADGVKAAPAVAAPVSRTVVV
jgi:hypothetical protein